MEYTNQTPLLLAGRAPSFAERQYWQRSLRGLRRVAVWLMTAITAYFAYSAWVTIFMMPFLEALGTAVVLLPATVLALWFPIYDNHNRENNLKTAWYNEQADKQRLDSGCRIALWDDRAVMTDYRGETTISFSQVTLCIETIHGFLLQSVGTTILIRSADMTPEQVEQVRARLKQAILPERYCSKQAAIGCLREPLPIPSFQNNDRVMARALLDMPSPRIRKRLKAARMFAVPTGVIYGVVVAQTVAVTGYYVADLIAFCAVGALLAYGLLVVLATRSKNEYVMVHIALTHDGLAAFCDGQHYFLTWERINVEHRYYSVRMYFPSGDRLRVAYAQFDDPEAVRQIGFKGDNYHG